MVQSRGPRTYPAILPLVPIRGAFVCGVVLAGFALGAIGCGKSSDQITVYPVQGKVLHEGKPAAGATVVFYPVAPIAQAKPLLPQGTVATDGSFQLRSYEANDGAPAGEYKVTVTWPGALPTGRNAEMYGPRDKLKGRYNDPETSGLTATVSEGQNVIDPFELE